MKKIHIALIVLTLWLAACGGSVGETQSTEAPLQLDAEGEWRIVYIQAVMLEAACSMLYETNWAFNSGEISLERVRTELEAEAEFVQTSQEELAILAAPSEAVVLSLAKLELAVLEMQAVLALGEAAVVEDDYDLWEGIFQTCDTLYDLQPQLLEDAMAAGLTQAVIDEFELDAGESVLVVYESTEWGRTAADAPVSTSAAPTQASGSSTADQVSLLTEWGPVYNMGALMFETCTVVYQTHYDFGQGVIDADRAQVELQAESEAVEYAMGILESSPPEGELAGGFFLQIRDEASVLTYWLEPQADRLGTPQALDTVGLTCESLQNIMNSIFTHAQAAGLTRESLDELDEEMRPMIEDLYNQTWYGR